MPGTTFDYSIIRVVPRVERGEFLNAGVLVSCPFQDFLEARIELDRARFEAFAPATDFDLIQEYLQTIPLICKGGNEGGPIGLLAQRARFHWLVAPRSTMIQFSPVHTGLCENPAAALDELFRKMVKPIEREDMATGATETGATETGATETGATEIGNANRFREIPDSASVGWSNPDARPTR